MNGSNALPLLSIVVPTRDRLETALACVTELTRMIGEDFEIVVCDCSSISVLGDELAALNDSRIRYHAGPPCSMTTNFNNAYAAARGRYVTFIGDDDIFLPTGLAVLRALAADNVEAIAYPYRATYYWDDFPVPAQAGRLFMDGLEPATALSIVASAHRNVSASGAIMETLAGAGSPILPVLYHGIVARDILEKIETKAGALFATVSPDTFVSAALCCVLNGYVVVDTPLTVYGKSGVSNSARVLDKADTTHRDQFGSEDVGWDPVIPPVETVEAHVANSYLVAFRLMGAEAIEAVFMQNYIGEIYALSLLRNPRRARAILSRAILALRQPQVLPVRFVAAALRRLSKRVGGRIKDKFAYHNPSRTVVTCAPSLSTAVVQIEARLAGD